MGGSNEMLFSNNKKAFLDNLFYNLGKQNYNFYVAGTFLQKDGTIGFSKWKTYMEAVSIIDFDGSCSSDWKKQKFFEQINQRQILPFEIVLDVEEREQIKPIILILKNLKSINVNEYFIYETGSRGYHIHIFMNENINERFSEEEKLFLIKKFGTDTQKCSDKTLIALENCPHWKTGKIKKQISEKEILDGK